MLFEVGSRIENTFQMSLTFTLCSKLKRLPGRLISEICTTDKSIHLKIDRVLGIFHVFFLNFGWVYVSLFYTRLKHFIKRSLKILALLFRCMLVISSSRQFGSIYLLAKKSGTYGMDTTGSLEPPFQMIRYDYHNMMVEILLFSLPVFDMWGLTISRANRLTSHTINHTCITDLCNSMDQKSVF